jgi:hypothetical protein
MALKQYLDPPDIVLNIAQLLGTYSQQQDISLSDVPVMMHNIQDTQVFG